MAAPNGRFASISHWENAITLTERRIPEITRPSCGSYADADHEKNMLDQIMLHTSWRLDNTQRNKKSHSANPSFAFAFYHRKNASTSKIFKKNVVVLHLNAPRADVAERYKKMINKNFGRGSPFTMPPETCFFRRSPFEQDICSTCIDLSDCKVKHRMTSRFPNLNQ